MGAAEEPEEAAQSSGGQEAKCAVSNTFQREFTEME